MSMLNHFCTICLPFVICSGCCEIYGPPEFAGGWLRSYEGKDKKTVYTAGVKFEIPIDRDHIPKKIDESLLDIKTYSTTDLDYWNNHMGYDPEQP
jgi:hypothetical protein